MSLIKKASLAYFALAIGLGFVGCTNEEKKVDSTVDATKHEEPAAPPSNTKFSAEPVYFDFDSSAIRGEAQASLSGIADHLKSNSAMIQIEGNTDERGTVEYNLALGERRAQAVKKYLRDLGVDGSRMTTISYGEEKPAVEGHTEEAWAKNRRAEFTITNQ